MKTKIITSDNSEALRSMEFRFIDITPRATQSGSIYEGSISKSNRFVCKLFVFDRNTSYHITVSKNKSKKQHINVNINLQCMKFLNI